MTCLFNEHAKVNVSLVTGNFLITAILFFPTYFFAIPLIPIVIIFSIVSYNIYVLPYLTLKKIYSLFVYTISCICLIIGSINAIGNMNTWGSFAVYAGLFMIVHFLPVLSLMCLIYNPKAIFGILKLLTGSIILMMIKTEGFGHSEYNTGSVDIIRGSVMFLSSILLLEGLLILMFKVFKRNKKSLKPASIKKSQTEGNFEVVKAQ